MKKQKLTIILITTICIQVNAQSNWSTGFRTGAALTNPQTLIDKNISSLLLNQQLYITKRVVKHLEVEVNASFKGSQTINASSGPIFDGAEYWTNKSTYRMFEAGLTARYFVLERKGWAPFLFAGLNISQTYIKSNTTVKDWDKPDAINSSTNSKEHDIPSEGYGGIGINKEIAKHWMLNAQLGLNINLVHGQFLDSYNPYPKLQAGIAYCW